MPVRSLNSAVFKWPTRSTVLPAARCWAIELMAGDAAVCQVACIGSYARGDWGVGSDLDVIVVLSDTELSPAQRYQKYYPDSLPVPVDLWVYTAKEWESLPSGAPGLWNRIQRELLQLAPETQPGA